MVDNCEKQSKHKKKTVENGRNWLKEFNTIETGRKNLKTIKKFFFFKWSKSVQNY